MSITIQATEFVNHPQDTKTYGFRIYDEYGAYYQNLWDSIPEDDIALLEKIMTERHEYSEDIKEAIEFIGEIHKGINIGDNYYDWDEIKYFF